MTDFYADSETLLLFRPLEDAGVTDAQVLTYDTLDTFLYLYDTDKTIEIWRAYGKNPGPVKAGYCQGVMTAIVFNRVARQTIAFTLDDEPPQKHGDILLEPRHLLAHRLGFRLLADDEVPDLFLMTAEAFREYLADEKTKIHDLKRFFESDDETPDE
jgi:hypothetical protein